MRIDIYDLLKYFYHQADLGPFPTKIESVKYGLMGS